MKFTGAQKHSTKHGQQNNRPLTHWLRTNSRPTETESLFFLLFFTFSCSIVCFNVYFQVHFAIKNTEFCSYILIIFAFVKEKQNSQLILPILRIITIVNGWKEQNTQQTVMTCQIVLFGKRLKRVRLCSIAAN